MNYDGIYCMGTPPMRGYIGNPSETLEGKAATVNRILTLYVLKTSARFIFIS